MNAGRYILRGLKANRRRYVLGAMSIVISTMIMITIGVVFSGGQNEFRGFFERAYAYDYEIHRAQEGFNTSYFEIDDVVANVTRIEGVESAHPILGVVLYGTVPGNSSGKPALIYGSSPSYTAGNVLSLKGQYDLSAGSAVLSRTMAKKWGLDVGSSLHLQTIFFQPPCNFTVNVTGVINVEGRFSPGVDEFVVIGLDYLGGALNLTGKATTLYALASPNLYDFQNTADPAAKVFDAGERIAGALGPDFLVTSMKGFLIRESMQGTSFFGVMVYVFSGFFPAISGVMVSSILNLSVEDRAHDLAILRLTGARRRSVGRIVMYELGLIILLGLPLGVALGVCLPFIFLGNLVASANILNVAVTILTQVLISLTVLLVFAIRPLRRAFRSDPIEAIRRTRALGELRFSQNRGIDSRIPLSGMLLFLAVTYATTVIPYILLFSTATEMVFFVLVSVMVILVSLCISLLAFAGFLERAVVAAASPVTPKTNKLSSRNIARYARRNLSTNVIFGVVVAILIFFTSLLSTVRGSIEDTARYEAGSDIRVRGAFSISESRFAAIVSSPGIQAGAGTGPKLQVELSNLVGPSGDKVSLGAADGRLPGATFLSNSDFFAGAPSAFDLDNGSIIISRATATGLNVEAGDTVRVDNQDRRSFLRVSAVLNTLPGFPFEITQTGGNSRGQSCFVSFPQYRYLVNESGSMNTYSSVFLKVAPGEDHEKVAETVKAHFADMEGFRISVTQTNVRQVVDATAFLDVMFSAVLIGMMMVAVFSLMSNLYASIKEREFEIGVLRAVGMRKSHILQSLMLEGLAVAFGSVSLGFVAGLVVGYIMVWFIGILSAIGFRFVLPYGVMGLVFVITLISSAIGVALTARAVTKKEVISLIKRTE